MTTRIRTKLAPEFNELPVRIRPPKKSSYCLTIYHTIFGDPEETPLTPPQRHYKKNHFFSITPISSDDAAQKNLFKSINKNRTPGRAVKPAIRLLEFH